MSMYLTLGVSLLDSTTEIQFVFSYQCNFGVPVWSANASMYLRIALFLLTALYMYLIYSSMDSDSTSG